MGVVGVGGCVCVCGGGGGGGGVGVSGQVLKDNNNEKLPITAMAIHSRERE